MVACGVLCVVRDFGRRGIRDETMVWLRKEREGEFSRVFSVAGGEDKG